LHTQRKEQAANDAFKAVLRAEEFEAANKKLKTASDTKARRISRLKKDLTAKEAEISNLQAVNESSGFVQQFSNERKATKSWEQEQLSKVLVNQHQTTLTLALQSAPNFVMTADCLSQVLAGPNSPGNLSQVAPTPSPDNSRTSKLHEAKQLHAQGLLPQHLYDEYVRKLMFD
jgi:hypothetical protein